jgi:sorbose reductase
MIVHIVLTVHPEEWRRQWFNMIPGRRLCNAAELKGSYVYIASDASSYMTGKTSINC